MRIIRIYDRMRRDFQAEWECEHCGHTIERGGYDDSYFHNVVVPNTPCPACSKTSGREFRPLEPRYPDSVTI